MSTLRRMLLFAKLNKEDMKEFKLINKVTLEEDVAQFNVLTDANGQTFECNELYIHFKCVNGDTGNNNISPSYSFVNTDRDWFGANTIGTGASNATRYLDVHVFRVADVLYEERNTYHISELYSRQLYFTYIKGNVNDTIKAVRFYVGNNTANILAGSEITIYGR